MVQEQQSSGKKGAAREMRTAARSLEESLGRIVAGNRQFENIEVRVTARRGGGGGLGPKLGCIITVEGDTQEDADKHCMEMQDQGCICRSTGPKTCECDCSPVE